MVLLAADVLNLVQEIFVYFFSEMKPGRWCVSCLHFYWFPLLLMSLLFVLMNPHVKFIQVVIIQNFTRFFLGYFITDEIDWQRGPLFSQPRAFDWSYSSVYFDGVGLQISFIHEKSCTLHKCLFNMIILSFLNCFCSAFFYISVSCWHVQFIPLHCDHHDHHTSCLILDL